MARRNFHLYHWIKILHTSCTELLKLFLKFRVMMPVPKHVPTGFIPRAKTYTVHEFLPNTKQCKILTSYYARSIESRLHHHSTKHAWDHGIKPDSFSQSPKKNTHPITFVKIKLTNTLKKPILGSKVLTNYQTESTKTI